MYFTVHHPSSQTPEIRTNRLEKCTEIRRTTKVVIVRLVARNAGPDAQHGPGIQVRDAQPGIESERIVGSPMRSCSGPPNNPHRIERRRRENAVITVAVAQISREFELNPQSRVSLQVAVVGEWRDRHPAR